MKAIVFSNNRNESININLIETDQYNKIQCLFLTANNNIQKERFQSSLFRFYRAGWWCLLLRVLLIDVHSCHKIIIKIQRREETTTDIEPWARNNKTRQTPITIQSSRCLNPVTRKTERKSLPIPRIPRIPRYKEEIFWWSIVRCALTLGIRKIKRSGDDMIWSWGWGGSYARDDKRDLFFFEWKKGDEKVVQGGS